MPDDEFSGSDSFTYVASDGELESDVATVTLTVAPGTGCPSLRRATMAVTALPRTRAMGARSEACTMVRSRVQESSSLRMRAS